MDEPFRGDTGEHCKGKAIFQGKAFCATCHGQDGRGLADIPDLRENCPETLPIISGRRPDQTGSCSGFSKTEVRERIWHPLCP